MDSGCCSFLFNLAFDCLIDVSALERSCLLKDALSRAQHSHPWGLHRAPARAVGFSFLLAELELGEMRKKPLNSGCAWEPSMAVVTLQRVETSSKGCAREGTTQRREGGRGELWFGL